MKAAMTAVKAATQGFGPNSRFRKVSHPTTIKSELTSSDRSVTKGSSSEYEDQERKDLNVVKDIEKVCNSYCFILYRQLN